MSHPAPALKMAKKQRSALERMARSETLSFRQVRQARALLLAADGVANAEIARRCEVSLPTVRDWRSRFAESGVAGVGRVRPGRGRRPEIPTETVEAIVHDTLRERPEDGSTHWTTRTMAERFGVGKDTVARIWRARNLKPWLVEVFKLSNDPCFEEKLVDVVGLYLDPLERAVVLCFDEKTQTQALDRTQPSLPLKPGRAGTMTHDYKRNGTTDLFAALDVATGEVLTHCRPSHTHKDFLFFLKLIDLHVPKDLDVHLVLDNLAVHKHPEVTKWLAHPKRARFHLHFTPTSSSWLNLVERWFREITDKRLRRGSFGSVAELIDAIDHWAAHWNDDPKPFVWHKTAAEIIAKVRRGRAALDQKINPRRTTRAWANARDQRTEQLLRDDGRRPLPNQRINFPCPRTDVPLRLRSRCEIDVSIRAGASTELDPRKTSSSRLERRRPRTAKTATRSTAAAIQARQFLGTGRPYRWRAASPEVPTMAPIAAQECPSTRAAATASARRRSAVARARKASRTVRSAAASLTSAGPDS